MSGARGKVLKKWGERRKAFGFARRAHLPCRSCGGGRGEVLAGRLARRVISELPLRGIKVGGSPAARRVMGRRRRQQSRRRSYVKEKDGMRK